VSATSDGFLCNHMHSIVLAFASLKPCVRDQVYTLIIASAAAHSLVL